MAACLGVFSGCLTNAWTRIVGNRSVVRKCDRRNQENRLTKYDMPYPLVMIR